MKPNSPSSSKAADRRDPPLTPADWEFFSRVRKTVVPRPPVPVVVDIRGQAGSVRAASAVIYGPNWHHDPYQDLIEIWDAGPALCFKNVLPRKDKYVREGLYLRLSLAYRTTANACANIRTFSGNNITLPNALDGALYDDPYTRFHVTDDCTLNINSLYRDERIWLQRVDWEWVSHETLFEDELGAGVAPILDRRREEVEAVYVEKPVNDETVKAMLIERLRTDTAFAKRCLLLLREDVLLRKNLADLQGMFNHDSA